MSARLVGALMVTLMGRQCLLRVSLSVSLGVISERKTRSITRTSEIESVQTESERTGIARFVQCTVSCNCGSRSYPRRLPTRLYGIPRLR